MNVNAIVTQLTNFYETTRRTVYYNTDEKEEFARLARSYLEGIKATDDTVSADISNLASLISNLATMENFLSLEQKVENCAKKTDLPSDYARASELRKLDDSVAKREDLPTDYAKDSDLKAVITDLADVARADGIEDMIAKIEACAKPSDIPDDYAKESTLLAIDKVVAKKIDVPLDYAKEGSLQNLASRVALKADIPSDYARRQDVPTDYAKEESLKALESKVAMKSDLPSDYVTRSDVQDKFLSVKQAVSESSVETANSIKAVLKDSLSGYSQLLTSLEAAMRSSAAAFLDNFSAEGQRIGQYKSLVDSLQPSIDRLQVFVETFNETALTAVEYSNLMKDVLLISQNYHALQMSFESVAQSSAENSKQLSSCLDFLKEERSQIADVYAKFKAYEEKLGVYNAGLETTKTVLDAVRTFKKPEVKEDDVW